MAGYEYSVDTNSYAPPVAKTKKEEEGFLFPQNTRYYRQEGKYTHSFLVEVKPALTEFRYVQERGYEDGRIPTIFEVATPWQYFWIHLQKAEDNDYGIRIKYNGAHIFWAVERVEDLDSPVFPAMLPNLCQKVNDIYSEHGLGVLCFGRGLPHEMKSFAQGAELVISNTYASDFNPNMRNGVPIPFEDPERWQIESRVPYAWMDWPDFRNNPNIMPLRKALIPQSGKNY